MRIGIDIRELEDGKFTGIGSYLIQFLNFCAQHDKDNEYVLFGNLQTNYVAVSENQKVIKFNETSTFLFDQVLLPKKIKEENLDVFLTPYFKAPIMCAVPLVLIVNDLIPLIVKEYQSIKYLLKRMYFKTLMSYSLKKASLILTISHATKRDVVKIFDVAENKIDVFNLAVEEKYRAGDFNADTLKKYGITKEYILYLGNFKPHKNVSAIIKAYSKLPGTLKNRYSLVLAGKKDNNIDELKDLACELDIKENIVVTGYVNEADAPSVFHGAKVFIFPSLYEGFGLPVLEAMACGTPVITSNVSSLPEVLGDAGLLVAPQDTISMKSSLEKLLQDEELCMNLVSKGKKRLDLYNVSSMSEVILAALKKVGEKNEGI